MLRYTFGLLSLLLSLLLTARESQAQEVLTLEEAVRVALERNYDIKLSANDERIAENNVSRGNAGMLPNVSANLTNNNTLQNSSQTRADGQVNEVSWGQGSSLNYGIGLNWTVFNGFAMFARYEQLQELEKLGETNLQLTILTRVGDVMSTFYELVQQQHQLRAYDTAISLSRLRVTTAQNRFEIGKAARLEVLNAQVDYNTDTTNLLRQQELYRNTQIRMNELMVRDVNIRFRVPDQLTIDEQLTLETLSAQAAQQNPSLKAAILNRRVAELDAKIVRASRLPVVGVNTGYNFNRNRSALGFSTLSTGNGLTYGVTASVPIFTGFNQRRNEQNANILINSAQLQFEQVNQNINAQLASAYQTYLTNISLVRLEENNQRIARQNLDITMEKYRLGSITTVEVRDAQLNYVNAAVRYSNAQYLAKLGEIALKEIAGTLTL
ncbi:TolC family protein [Rufibacter glacialis]|uniref:TolC family protein n=1 Tax=Rufibacter glacialis TaxID=1259555 RepID=A0A5M8QLH2_9BACT|nr:TolC family protein [Rufibacter glacialis]KAA6435820.1 TolC family protein [Rufibacter glacialis]GGK66860.1 membrane protein [Rufibacter glacialis]